MFKDRKMHFVADIRLSEKLAFFKKSRTMTVEAFRLKAMPRTTFGGQTLGLAQMARG
jgi:hypothetical protein